MVQVRPVPVVRSVLKRLPLPIMEYLTHGVVMQPEIPRSLVRVVEAEFLFLLQVH